MNVDDILNDLKFEELENLNTLWLVLSNKQNVENEMKNFKTPTY